jgi:putative ABC transport system ATP-binding protein
MTTTETATTAAAAAVHATKVYHAGDTIVRALDDVTLDLAEGRFTAIMGPSGSGKSTLLHCLAGLDSLTEGHALIGGVDLSRLNDRQLTALRRDRVGFVFQFFNLIPTLTAAENITLPMTLAGRKPDQAWLGHIIDSLDLRDRLAHRPSQLSGGQQQRVAIARALINRPQIVFADEPTGNLDSRAGADVLRILAAATVQLGQTVAMVTHDPIAAGYADTAVFLADGRLVDQLDDPTPERVLDRLKALGS